MADKKTTRKKKVVIDTEILKKLGPSTSKNFKYNKWNLTKSNISTSKDNAYSKTNNQTKYEFEKGCDLLQYSIVVKPYIYKKFNIEHPIELDILLFLYPYQYFTRSDFSLLPVSMYNYTFKSLIEIGYIDKCVDNRIRTKVVWKLSEFAKKIVKEYYLYLSGERKINPKAESNPFKTPDAAKADEKRNRIMMKLRAQAERHPERFNKYHGLPS